MKIHIGEKIKSQAKELRIGTTELAKSINTSKQNIYGIFKRESIDTALLQKFCKVLNYDFFTFFVNHKLPPNIGNTESIKKGKAYTSAEGDTEFNVLKNQLMDLKEKYELVKKVNVLLEEKKRRGK
ncbi:MAG: helix-turn-helix transcriptional regulator [Bacteroidota bacterium]|nr:helix-turn-helix transcriptional regulator [Bacteroidota bacterium]